MVKIDPVFLELLLKLPKKMNNKDKNLPVE